MSPGLESASREGLLALIGLLQRQVEAAEARAALLEEQNERLTARGWRWSGVWAVTRAVRFGPR
jgi:hypothetical protein